MAFTASTVWEVQTTGVDDFSVVSATVAAGGTGYSVGNTLTVTGGTSTTTATFTVATVSGGVVLTVTPLNAGHYTVVPANPAATTGGAGTCTLNITWNAGGNGGGFDTGVAGFPTDGAVTSATSAAPVFSSASYNFVAGDVGAWIYIKSGTSSIPGWYKIASVAANAATLNATIGAAVLAAGTPSTATGCGTATPLASATWGIDYSQGTAGNIAFTDMVVGATTTQFTSVGHPVGKNFVGNIISVNSGATVQRVAVVSTSGTTATCDKSLGTAAQTGVGNLGGPLASAGQAGALATVNNMSVYIQTGAYSVTQGTNNVPAGLFVSSVVLIIEGYSSVRGDLGTPPVLTASGISTVIIMKFSANSLVRNITIDGASLTSINAFACATGIYYKLKGLNCTNSAFANNSGSPTFIACHATGCSTQPAFTNSGPLILCEAYNNTVTGFNMAGGGPIAVFCLAYNNTLTSSDGFSLTGTNACCYNCVSYGNGRDGFRATTSENTLVNCIAETNVGVGYTVNTGPCVMLNCAGYSTGTNVSFTAVRSMNIGFVTGSASFFINAAGGNFALNNTTGAGAACRAAGIPGIFPSGTTTGYQDIGAAQSRVPWQTTNLSGGLIG